MGEENTVIIGGWEILTRANQCRDAAKLLYKHCETNNVAIPIEIIASFACELYLKYLINFPNGRDQTVKADELKPKRTHDLSGLYDAVNCDCRSKIKCKMEEKGKGDRREEYKFEDELKNLGSNFQKIRYEYEHKDVTYSPSFFMIFVDVLSDICN